MTTMTATVGGVRVEVAGNVASFFDATLGTPLGTLPWYEYPGMCFGDEEIGVSEDTLQSLSDELSSLELASMPDVVYWR